MKDYTENAELYEWQYTRYEADIPFYTSLAKKSAGAVLELGCGTGRVTFPIAEAGISITGLELSKDMLAVAHRKHRQLPFEVKKQVKLIQGDMTHFQLKNKFQLVIIPFRAFLYLLTTGAQRAVFDCVYRHLLPGGRLALDFFESDRLLIQKYVEAFGEQYLYYGETFLNPQTGRLIQEWEARRYEMDQQLLTCFLKYKEVDHTGIVCHEIDSSLRLRWIYQDEMVTMLSQSGFEVETCLNSFHAQGHPRYGKELIWVARKRDA